VDRNHNVSGNRTLEADAARVSLERDLMHQAPYLLDARARGAVLEAIQEVCLHRRWSLLAAHIRMTHVHAVVDAESKPENVMNAFKSYASRRLNQMSADGARSKAMVAARKHPLVEGPGEYCRCDSVCGGWTR
jgi:hypothetical protein